VPSNDKTSTEVAVKETALPVGMTQEDYDALLQQQEGEFVGSDLLQTPILKIGQGLTREVQAGDADAGEFIDTVRGEGLGDKIGFIVAYYQQGRFAADRETGRAYVAFGETIPETWEPFVGAEFVGTRFDEYPDAEEQYKARVNRKEIEWGKGPKVSTTHNFTGYSITDSLDEDDPEPVLSPARLSLQRTNVPAVRKWMTLRRSALRNRPFWEVVFDLSTEKNSYAKGQAFNLVVKIGRKTTDEEKMLAVELAQAVAAGRVVDNQEADATGDAKVEPETGGGLAI
jgi:hypothetical protein